jgi:XTP/dITP diphosphohydrolase
VVHLLLATANAHKTREFAEILRPDFAVRDLSDMRDLPQVEETGSTFEENARLKALAASAHVPGLVVADDSGLEVAVLNGAPGVYSARYAGEGASDAANVAKLLAELRAYPSRGDRSARFCCALAVARDGEILDVLLGTAEGEIVEAPRGPNGFGYDPVFVPAGFHETFAELGEEKKNRISHRADAIRKLRDLLANGDVRDSRRN